MRPVTAFVLLHGAWHGPWCWERLVPELHARGHETLTVDLPFDDAGATFDDCADVVVSATAAAPDDCVLVGHSLAGMLLPLVSTRRTVGLMVFLCAVIPHPGAMPWDGAGPMGDDDYGAVEDDDGALTFPSLETARAVFYADCSPDDSAWAFERLRPLRNASLWDRPYPLAAWPSTRAAAIACTDDRAIYAAYQREALRDRLGIAPIELPGHHSPFLARPAELADALTGLA